MRIRPVAKRTCERQLLRYFKQGKFFPSKFFPLLKAECEISKNNAILCKNRDSMKTFFTNPARTWKRGLDNWSSKICRKNQKEEGYWWKACWIFATYSLISCIDAWKCDVNTAFCWLAAQSNYSVAGIALSSHIHCEWKMRTDIPLWIIGIICGCSCELEHLILFYVRVINGHGR